MQQMSSYPAWSKAADAAANGLLAAMVGATAGVILGAMVDKVASQLSNTKPEPTFAKIGATAGSICCAASYGPWGLAGLSFVGASYLYMNRKPKPPGYWTIDLNDSTPEKKE